MFDLANANTKVPQVSRVPNTDAERGAFDVYTVEYHGIADAYYSTVLLIPLRTVNLKLMNKKFLPHCHFNLNLNSKLMNK